MTTVLIVLFGIGIVGGLFLRKQSPAAGTAVMVACGGMGAVLAIGRIVSSAQGPPTFAAVASELEANNRAMALELGRYLVDQAAGTRALCVLEPSDPYNDSVRVGLEQSLGGAIPVEFVVLERRDQDEAMDILQLTPGYLQDLLDEHPQADLLICLAGLPWDASGAIAALLKSRNVRLATGSDSEPSSLRAYVQAGVFAGGAAFRDEPGTVKSYKKATPGEIFEANYVLLPAQGG